MKEQTKAILKKIKKLYESYLAISKGLLNN